MKLQKGKHLLEKRLSSGKNYIPEFYNKEKILKVAKNTGLNLNGYYTYLFLDKFSPYNFFVPSYQFLYGISTMQETLDKNMAELYSTVYSKFIYKLSFLLPEYMHENYNRSITDDLNGCHMITILSKN